MHAQTFNSGMENFDHILKTMDVITQSTFTVFFFVEFIIGILGNGFIALVNCLDWVKRRKVSSVHQILTALAISRIALFLLAFIVILLGFDYAGLFKSKTILKMVYISWVISNHFNSWLATCLSIFYFLKVANFSNSTFHFLQWRIKESVSMTLLVSLLFLALDILVTNTHLDSWVDLSTSNKSLSSKMIQSERLTNFLLFTCSMLSFIPFTVSLTTFLLLIISLSKHLRRMQSNIQGCRDVTTTAHIRALQTMMAFLLLNFMFLLLLIFEISSLEILEKNAIIYDQITKTAFPAGHSYILILTDSKLRQASLRWLRWVKRKLTNAYKFCP